MKKTTQNNDGGPAFAAAMPACPPSHDFEWQAGMSLRDYFAGCVLSVVAYRLNPDADSVEARADVLNVAVDAYFWADAMLKAREFPGSEFL